MSNRSFITKNTNRKIDAYGCSPNINANVPRMLSKSEDLILIFAQSVGAIMHPWFGLAKIKDGFVRIVLKKRKKKRRRWQIDESSGTNHSNYLHHTCCNMLD